ncbi:type II toxin-antitoxin system RelE/ParE family toxin [bacterium]|nr:type II toxin-antitoxin system RelE/ParE family toxin [Bacteroidota bacterium]MBL7190324.1 type II toxin-antitoxin system RelE/ParE family toxin [bacterium]
MTYDIVLKPQAIKDLKMIPKTDAKHIFNRLEILTVDLKGDVKQLTNFTPEYRLRIGNYRILFEIESDNKIVVYRIINRKDAYKKRK